MNTHHSGTKTKTTELKRVIGFWGGTAIVVGCVVGAGIFRTPASIANVLQNPLLIIALWVGAGLLCLCGALALAELSTMMPRTGGTYVYIRAAYGDSAAFTFGWLYVVAAIPSGIAALATFFGELMLHLAGQNPATAAPYMIPGIAVAMLVVLSLVNVRGVALGAMVQTTFTIIKTLALVLVVFVAFLVVDGHIEHLAPASGGLELNGGFVGLAAALSFVFYTYNGWVYIGLVGGEIEKPEKRLKPMLLTGVIIILIIYVVTNLAYVYAFPVNTMQDKHVAQDIMTQAFGPIGGKFIAACIVASVFGTMNGTILTNSHVAYAPARDGLSFKFLGRCHPKWATPDASIMTQGAIAVVLTLWLKNFDALASYFVVVEWTALIFIIGTVFILRRKLPHFPRPYKVPGYPLIPLIFVVGTTVGLAAIVWSRIELYNYYNPFLGLGIACLGFPVYYIWKAVNSRWGNDVFHEDASVF